MYIKLWLDDQRHSPEGEGWIRVDTAADAIAILETGLVEKVSLDYDICWSDAQQENWEDRQTGYAVAKWIGDADGTLWPRVITIHSSNKVGRARMMSALCTDGVPYLVYE